MGTSNDGRWNERAENWSLTHLKRLADIAVASGLTVAEAYDWAEAQNPYRAENRKQKATAVEQPTLFPCVGLNAGETMARPKFHGDLNMDSADLKRRFMGWVGLLSGLYEVNVRPRRPLGSQKQHGYYHSSVVRPFAEWMGEQENDLDLEDAAHQQLKQKFLTVTIRHPRTLQPIGTVTRSTRSLTTEEMTKYVDACRGWLLDFHGIVTMDPEPDPAKRERNKRAARDTAARG